MTKTFKPCWTSSTIKMPSKIFWAVRDVKLYRPRAFSSLIYKKKNRQKQVRKLTALITITWADYHRTKTIIYFYRVSRRVSEELITARTHLDAIIDCLDLKPNDAIGRTIKSQGKKQTSIAAEEVAICLLFFFVVVMGMKNVSLTIKVLEMC